MARWRTSVRWRSSRTNSGWEVGSPPESVIPPLFISKITRSFKSFVASSLAVYTVPAILRRWTGQTRIHAPQAMQWSGCLHMEMHFPQWRQPLSLTISWGLKESPYWLWHQRQRRGHPFINTVVRIPGPSKTASCFISKITPVALMFSSFFCLAGQKHKVLFESFVHDVMKTFKLKEVTMKTFILFLS